jgi:hypothetical protein
MSEPAETAGGNDSEYQIVMPFITVTSKGGPHDDASYVAGYQMGLIDARLAMLASTCGDDSGMVSTVSVENRTQADLLAMRHGFTVNFDEPAPESPDWLRASFRRGATALKEDQ